MRIDMRALRSTAPFWSVRYHEEKRETLAMRQDTLEPPRLSMDRGAMVSAMVDGGYGYCATGDLSTAGLQAALDRASEWARATKGKSVVRFDPSQIGAPKGEYQSPDSGKKLNAGEIHDLLAQECRGAKLDDRIVERFAALEVVEDERLYVTSTGGEVRQRFRFTVPHLRVTANQGTDTQSRSLDFARQGGFENLDHSAFLGSGARLADEALQLLTAPNCPSGKMDLLLMPDQMMLQVHESIGHPLELDRILGDERNYAGTSFVTPEMFGSYRYGSDLLNIPFHPTPSEEFASYGFDDEGQPARREHLIRDGILVRGLGGMTS